MPASPASHAHLEPAREPIAGACPPVDDDGSIRHGGGLGVGGPGCSSGLSLNRSPSLRLGCSKRLGSSRLSTSSFSTSSRSTSRLDAGSLDSSSLDCSSLHSSSLSRGSLSSSSSFSSSSLSSGSLSTSSLSSGSLCCSGNVSSSSICCLSSSSPVLSASDLSAQLAWAAMSALERLAGGRLVEVIGGGGGEGVG